jgi:outer membrane biosynthesis protein TonB
MKTVNFIRAIFMIMLVICSSVISSYAIEPAMPSSENLQKVLRESIKYPEQAVRNCCTGSVDVYFTVDGDGKIRIEKTIAENSHVDRMVKDQLSSICCKGIKVPYNEHYKIKITFKLVG